MYLALSIIAFGIFGLLLHKEIVYKERDRFINGHNTKEYIAVYTRGLIHTRFMVYQTVTNKNPNVFKTADSIEAARFANDCMRKSSMAHPIAAVLDKVEQMLEHIKKEIEEREHQ